MKARKRKFNPVEGAPKVSAEFQNLKKKLIFPKPRPPQPEFRPITGDSRLGWRLRSIPRAMLRRGRAPAMEDHTTFLIRVSVRELAHIKITARQLGISASALIRLSLRRFLRATGCPPAPITPRQRASLKTILNRAEEEAMGTRIYRMRYRPRAIETRLAALLDGMEANTPLYIAPAPVLPTAPPSRYFQKGVKYQAEKAQIGYAALVPDPTADPTPPPSPPPPPIPPAPTPPPKKEKPPFIPLPQLAPPAQPSQSVRRLMLKNPNLPKRRP